MSTLRVIRHGQASYFEDDYDQLSPLGLEQARRLGQHWIEVNGTIDRVVVGPRRRHRQTMEAVAAVYRERRKPWPAPEVVVELDEHHGQEIVDRTLPGWIDGRPEFAALSAKTPENLRLYFRAFREITSQWAHGELATPEDLESWTSFRRRVNRALERIAAETGRGRTVVAFTSGGPVATAAGLALDLAHDKVLALSWRVRNTAHAELLFSDDAFALDTFNAHPHLTEPRLVTYI